MIFCETIDGSDCENIEKVLKTLINTQMENDIFKQIRLPILIYPNGLFDMKPQLLEYMRFEVHLSTVELGQYVEALNQLQIYEDEANTVYTVIENYLETRNKDNYKEVLYKDSINLIQLRQEKIFMIQLLILALLSEEIEHNNAFSTLLVWFTKEIKLTASKKFASLKLRTQEIVQHGLNLIEELKDSDRLDKMIVPTLERQSSKRSMLSSLRKTSYNNNYELSQQIQSQELKWLLVELQNNQILCRELVPNLRFIVKNYCKQFITSDSKRVTKGSIFDYRQRLHLGNQRNKAGLIELPTIGPMDSITGISLQYIQSLEQEQQTNTKMAIMQIDNYLEGDLLNDLVGTELILESDVQSESSHQSSQSNFRTFQQQNEL